MFHVAIEPDLLLRLFEQRHTDELASLFRDNRVHLEAELDWLAQQFSPETRSVQCPVSFSLAGITRGACRRQSIDWPHTTLVPSQLPPDTGFRSDLYAYPKSLNCSSIASKQPIHGICSLTLRFVKDVGIALRGGNISVPHDCHDDNQRHLLSCQQAPA